MISQAMESPALKPLLLFDGDCGFCKFWVDRWKTQVHGRVEFLPYQQAAARIPSVPVEDFEKSIVFRDGAGRIYRGAAAVFAALAENSRFRWLKAAYERIPVLRRVTEGVYGLVARHRVGFSRVTRLLFGANPQPSTYRVTMEVFLRGLGLCYVAATISLWVQLRGLIGTGGILPSELGEPALHALCAAGVLGGLGLMIGRARIACAAIAWISYAVLTSQCREFLWFQWDSLLIEMGLLGLFLAVTRAKSVLFLVWWLCFRLFFHSGYVKLASGDPSWRSLTALFYHYESQPLPTWIGWYVAHLPSWFQRISCAGVLITELSFPFLIFLPRRPKILACAGFLVLQLLINLTGNYGFFGLQAAVLSIALLDDAFWRERFPRLARLKLPEAWLPYFWVPLPLIGVVAGISLFRVSALSDALGPYRVVNSYGVFAVMTTERDEIILEGSDDRVNWKSYEFRWKPGDVSRRPSFALFHMPRLDWQMWFAALGSARQNPWFFNFMERLLEGSPVVQGLLAVNPFPKQPPKFLRAKLYRYRFSDLSRPQGVWWTREELGLYAPTLSLQSLQPAS